MLRSEYKIGDNVKAATISSLVEINRGTPKEDKKAINFRAKLLGLIYENILEQYFRKTGYEVIRKDYRSGTYKDKKFAVDYILEKNGVYYVVEAKCWPPYNEGRLKTFNIETNRKIIERKREDFNRLKTFLNREFISHYKAKIDKQDIKAEGKILVWWDVDKDDAEDLRNICGLDEIISIEEILEKHKDKIKEVIIEYKQYADELFNSLLSFKNQVL